jgi:hypothetical protein
MGGKTLEIPSRRVGLTVPHALNETLQRLATLQGKSKSRIVLEFLQECEPAFEQIVSGLEAAQKNKSQALKITLQMQQQALSKLSDTMKDFNDNLEFDLGHKPE